VWQPCELLYTCYLLTYIQNTEIKLTTMQLLNRLNSTFSIHFTVLRGLVDNMAECGVKEPRFESRRGNGLLLLHPFNGHFSGTTWVSRYQKGKTIPNLNEARDDGVWGWQWHQLDHMQTICTSLQTDNHNNTSSLNFYRSDALPDTQQTVSKQWRHILLPLLLLGPYYSF